MYSVTYAKNGVLDTCLLYLLRSRPKNRENSLFPISRFPEDTITKLSSKFDLHSVPISHQTNTNNMAIRGVNNRQTIFV
jgi:hypothetical protein